MEVAGLAPRMALVLVDNWHADDCDWPSAGGLISSFAPCLECAGRNHPRVRRPYRGVASDSKAALDPTRRFGGETLTTAETLSVADRPALQIICGTGAEYENTKAVSLYRLQRTFSIALQNSSRNMFVSNCKLYLDIINPKTGSPARHLIQDSFTLNPTESRLVEIVHYAEPTGSTRGDTEKDRIVLHLPLPTGWASRDMWPWWLPLGAYVITLTALSRESEPCEAVFKIWVDESYRLHFGTA
jgi:hypothetical protein